MADATVEVVVEIGGEQLLAGQLWAHRRRGTESATFRYDPGYLANKSAYGLDPGLPLLEGPQQAPVSRAMPMPTRHPPWAGVRSHATVRLRIS